jgi:NAD-dependent oxidoreductase involved in siderophore biosynthesis
MSSIKDLKLAGRSVVLQQEVVSELNTLVRDIERCEKTILDLQGELTEVNTKYPSPRTTRQDVAYLTDLLKCANKKLAWEKQIASMQKRTPATLEKMAHLLNDPKNPPADAMRVEMLRALQGVQAAMERLQGLKTGGDEENIQQPTPNIEPPTSNPE